MASPMKIEIDVKKDSVKQFANLKISLLWNAITVPINLSSIADNNQKFKRFSGKWLLSKPWVMQLSYFAVMILLKFITLHKLHLQLKYGCGNAFWTGITGGIGWALTGNLLHLIKKMHKSQNYYENIDLTPDYQNLNLQGEFNCSISFRICHVVLTLLLTVIYQFRRRFYQWKNIQFKV